MSAEYEQAIAQANINLTDLRERGEDAIGEDALAFIRGLLTPEEIAASDLRVAMMFDIANARKARGLSQKKLEKLGR